MNSVNIFESHHRMDIGGRTNQLPKKSGYRVVPFSMNRRLVEASASTGRVSNSIHAFIEVDITRPRQMFREFYQRTGEKLSLTTYVIACLAKAVAEYPNFNSFRKGNKLIILEDVTIGVQIEREIDGEFVPDPIGIRAAQKKTYRQIQEEIRGAQEKGEDKIGGQTGMSWVRFIPGFLLRTFFNLASKNITMMEKYGAIGVTAIGMFGSKNQAMWFLPLTAATVTLMVGGIVERPCVRDGQLETREQLCLTVSFNHDIVDGAPATRFIKRFSTLLKEGDLLQDEMTIR